MTPDLKAMQKALWIAKRVASHVDPGFAHVPLPTPGQPIPLQHAAGGRVGKAGGGAQGDGQTLPLPGFSVPSATTRPLNNIGLYSHAAEQAAALQQKKGSGQQMLASLKGVKPDELKWSGAQEKFGARPSVTREELAHHFRENLPPIEEQTFGGEAKVQPQTPEHLSPDYPHLVTHNQWEGAMSDAARRGDFAEHANLRDAHYNFLRDQNRTMAGGSAGRNNDTQYERYTVPGGENYRETVLKRPDSPGGPEYQHAGHWSGIENPVVHIRKKDRVAVETGAPLLHLEELQSDWAQAGRQRGFKPEGYDKEKQRLWQALRVARADKELASGRFGQVFHDNEHPDYERLAHNQMKATNAFDAAEEAYFRHERLHSGAVTPAPYVTKMEGPVDLGLKHALTEAAHNGYSGLSWSTGDQSNDHYPGTVRRADFAEYRPGSHSVSVKDNHDHEVQSIPLPPSGEDADYASALRPHLGDEVAEMLHDRIHEYHMPHLDYEGERSAYDPTDWVEPPHVNIRHLGITKGGEGLKNHYDKIIPQRVAALMKEHDPDAKVGMIDVPEDNDDYHDPDEAHRVHHIPITEKARQSIIKNGFKAYRHGGFVERTGKAGGGSLGDGASQKWRTVIGGSGPKVSETANPKRILFHAEGPGGVKGIIVPRHTWEGGNGKFGRLAGLAEINQARAQVYGPEPRAPLNVGQIEKAHKAALDEHFSMPIPHQIAAENAALERLRAAKHISGGADTLDEGEKLDTVKHEYDHQGRSYVAYGAKGTAGHALYSSGTGDAEKIHVLNTCSGQTNGCGGGIDENGIVDTRRGTCFAPKAEGQYAGAAIRRAAHEQAKHDPAMTKDWVLAHTGSLRNAAQRADKTNNVVLFRPNVLDETDRSTRHVLKGLNKQRAAQGLPSIIANSYGKTNELHDPENGYFITHSNIGPKTKHGASIQENIGKDRQRIRSTIMAADAGGRDFRNEEGRLTPPKNSYMVSDVARDSPMDAALQQAITHAKYWSAPREQHELSAAERAEGPEGHFGPNGQPVPPHMSHFGHTTLNGRRYDYQRQHILHPRYVKVGQNDDGSDHMIPTDSRFKDDEFLPRDRFMTKNGKQAGAILFTTPTKSTSGVERQSSFTHHVNKGHIEHALRNSGEYEVDAPHAQEQARGKEYNPPVNPAGKYAHGGAVHGDDDIEGTAFPSQSFCAQHHLAHRADEDPLPPQVRARGAIKAPPRASDIVTRAMGVIPPRV